MRLAFVVLALLASGCRARPLYTRVSADNHELRDAFDADTDKVRVVMLVSPG